MLLRSSSNPALDGTDTPSGCFRNSVKLDGYNRAGAHLLLWIGVPEICVSDA